MFGKKILNYWNDIVRDLAVAVSIPSVVRSRRESILTEKRLPRFWTLFWTWPSLMVWKPKM